MPPIDDDYEDVKLEEAGEESKKSAIAKEEQIVAEEELAEEVAVSEKKSEQKS